MTKKLQNLKIFLTKGRERISQIWGKSFEGERALRGKAGDTY